MPRPKGTPKTGGRQKGTLNKRTALVNQGKELADPAAFLSRVVNGEVIDGETPNLGQRVQAAKELMPFMFPKLSSIEHTGEVGVSDEARAGVSSLLTQYGIPSGASRTDRPEN